MNIEGYIASMYNNGIHVGKITDSFHNQRPRPDPKNDIQGSEDPSGATRDNTLVPPCIKNTRNMLVTAQTTTEYITRIHSIDHVNRRKHVRTPVTGGPYKYNK